MSLIFLSVLSFLFICAFLLCNTDKVQPKALLKLNVNLLYCFQLLHISIYKQKTSGCAETDLILLFLMNTEIVSVHLLLVIGRSEQFSAECCSGQNSEDCRSPAETTYWVRECEYQ